MEPENLLLKCMTCGEEMAPTSSNYAAMIRQDKHRDHKIRFLDKTTGEVVAKSGQEALRKGLIQPKTDTGEEGLEFTLDGDALIPMKISLPASALTLYYYAKRNNISDHANIIDFLWEYAQKGFMEAHNLGLTLAPVKVAPQSGDGALKKAVEELTAKFDEVLGKGKVEDPDTKRSHHKKEAAKEA